MPGQAVDLSPNEDLETQSPPQLSILPVTSYSPSVTWLGKFSAVQTPETVPKFKLGRGEEQVMGRPIITSRSIYIPAQSASSPESQYSQSLS